MNSTTDSTSPYENYFEFDENENYFDSKFDDDVDECLAEAVPVDMLQKEPQDEEFCKGKEPKLVARPSLTVRLVQVGASPQDGPSNFLSNPELQKAPETTETGKSKLDLFKMGRDCLSVTDLVNQFWCEQQFEYSFTCPVEKPPSEIVVRGKDIHLERELQVHDIIPVTCKTKEDKWALQFLNCFYQLSTLHLGNKIREIPVLGELFCQEIFIRGIIDEVRYSDTGGLEIVELKTRHNKKTLPSKAQQKTNNFQVMLYRKLLEDLLKGITDKTVIKRQLMLCWDKELCKDIIEYSEELHIRCKTVEDVLDVLINFIKISDFPCFDSMTIEYCSQEDRKVFHRINVEFDESWLKSVASHATSYLFGSRDAVGADIEEAWKCHNCDYFDICSWRQRQEEKCRTGNVVKETPNPH